MKAKIILLSVVLFVFVSGCGYHLGSVPPAGITSIYIPMLENKVERQEITADVTDGIIKRFKTDGTVRVTNKEKADAILYATISGYKTEAVLFDQQDVGEEFRVIITVDVTLIKVEDNSVIYRSPKGIEGQATTQITLNQFEAEKNILPDIIKDLSRKVVEAVIESAW